MASPYIFQDLDFEDQSNEGFQPSAFVSKYRRVGFSLETLREQLQSYSSSIKQELFVIINRDYKDFITIATSLDGVDSRVEYIRKPLLDLRADLSTLHDGLVSSLRSIEDKLAAYHDVAFKKKLVETFLDTAHRIQSAQSILSADYDNQNAALTSGSEINKVQSKRELLVRKKTDNRDHQAAVKSTFICSEIERAAYELSAATHNLSLILSLLNQQQSVGHGSNRDHAVVRGASKRSEKQLHQSLETQAASLSKLLVQKLTSKLASILAAEEMAIQRKRDGDKDSTDQFPPTAEKALTLRAFGHCLRACNIVRRGDIAEKIVAEAVVEPSIRANMTAAKVDGKNGRGSFSGLDTVLQAILSSVRAYLVPFLNEGEAVLSCSSRDSASCDLIIKSIWLPISTVLLEKYSGMFTTGIPAVLSECFRTVDRFLSSLQELASPAWQMALARRIRSHQTVRDFQARWKLDVYYQLRCNEVLSRIEKACYVSSKHGWTSAIARSVVSAMYSGDSSDEKKSVSGEIGLIAYINSHLSNSISLSSAESQRLRKEILDDFNAEFQCAIFTTFSVELLTCLQKSVLLPALSAKFLTFILRILQRLEAQIAAACNTLTASFGRLTIEQLRQSVLQSLNKTASSSLKDSTAEKDSSITTAISSAPTASSANAAAVSVLPSVPLLQAADEFVLLVQDLLAFESWVFSSLQMKVKSEFTDIHNFNVLAGLTETDAAEGRLEIERSIATCFEAAQFNLRSTTVAVWLKMSQVVSSECKKGLASSVKGIAGKFRMTNKPPPDSASPFIEPIFNPLRKLHSTHENVIKLFQEAFSETNSKERDEKAFLTAASDWRADLVEDVASHYCEQLKALMETVKQMDSALMRRAKMRTATSTSSTGASNMSDSEKIYMQVTLDIDAFRREVEQLGIDSAKLRSFRELTDVKTEIAALIAASSQN